MDVLGQIQALVKALEAGSYNAAPDTLTQGAALQVEDVSPVMNLVTFEDKHVKLQKKVKVTSCKSLLAQFDRQLSYGQFGGSAVLEGHIGQEETSDYVRITVPMAFYSHTRRVTLQSTMVATVDGVKSDERAAQDAAKKIMADFEFDLFRGMDDFSNAGTFDGNPFTVPNLPNLQGVGLQVRQSDNQRNSHDLMFAEYGSDETVVISCGGVLRQEVIEDASVRSALNFGNAETLLIDPRTLANYNKIAFGKERIVLAGSPQEATGADLRKQWVSGGTVSVEGSRFLSGKYKPAPARANGPASPASVTPASVTDATAPTAFKVGEVYTYYATACNELGESTPCAAVAVTILVDADKVTVTIAKPVSGVWRYFNVYRSAAGGTAASAKFIGRVIDSGAATTVFTDLGNKLPGFVTGYLFETDTMEVRELAPYSRKKLAETDLTMPEAHFRFATLAIMQPRKNVIVDNIT